MITYLELLQMVKDGKQPKKIKVKISPLWVSKFTWTNYVGYVDDSYARLPLCLANTNSDISLVGRKCIEVEEE